MRIGINGRSLASEALARLSVQAGFLAILIFAFEQKIKIGEIGLISVAMLVPGLIWTWIAADTTHWLGPRLAYLVPLALRSLLMLLLPWIARDVISCALCSGLIGLLTQAANAAKLVYDGQRLPVERRARFNATRASLGSLALILGPSLAGLAAAQLGGSWALWVSGGLGLAGALILVDRSGELRTSVADTCEMHTGTVNTGVASRGRASMLWWELRASPDLLIVICLYILITAILEMEFPLILPFVKEVYGLSSDAGGALIGVCGFGALAGSLAMRRFGGPLSAFALTCLLAFDGLVLLAATLGPPLSVCYGLFVALGVISSVTMVTVETDVQNSVSPDHQAFLFSAMGFVGGAGGAVLTLASTQLAEWIGCNRVLRGCALFEIGLSFICMGLLFVLRRPGKVAISSPEN